MSRAEFLGTFELNFGYTRIYGVFVEFLSAAAQHVIPGDLWVVRHYVNAVSDGPGVVFAFLMARRLFGVRAGWLAAALLACMPRYMADSMNNPKDLPFAVLMLAASYYILSVKEHYPYFSWPHALKLGAAIALAVKDGRWDCYCSDTLAWRWRLRRRRPRLRSAAARGDGGPIRGGHARRAHRRCGVLALGAGAAADAALRSVLPGVRIQLGQSFAVHGGDDLRHGRPLVLPADVDRHHDPRRRARRHGFAGGACWHSPPGPRAPGGVVGARALSGGQRDGASVSLYDGIRHMLFIVPPMAVLAAAGWEFCCAARRAAGLALVAGALALMIAEPFVFQIRNHPNQAVYFTPAVGGPRGAFGRYDLDYWGNCILEATEWAASQAARAGMPLGVASNAWEVAAMDAGRFNELYFRQQRHAGWHLNLMLLKGSTENIAEMSPTRRSVPRADRRRHAVVCRAARSGVPASRRPVGIRLSARRGGRDGAMSDLQARTIADFGEQWTEYPDSDGFFGSVELFNDIFAPLLSAGDVAGKQVAEIGAGIGRFVKSSRRPGRRASSPSNRPAPFGCCRRAPRRIASASPISADRRSAAAVGRSRLRIRRSACCTTFPNPIPVVAASFKALKPGGKVAVWLYGREGNSMYLLLVRTLWLLTRRLPHRLLDWFVAALYPFFWCYMTACRWLPLPLAAYMRRVMLPLTPAKRRVVIYDQLNPAYAKYYTRREAHDVIASRGSSTSAFTIATATAGP